MLKKLMKWVDKAKKVGRSKFKGYSIPYVTFILVAVNSLIFFAGIKWPYSGDGPLPLIGSIFSHANLDHLAGNMFFLTLIGPSIERYLGHLKFSILYMFAGLAAGVGFLLLNPDASVVGASGAISGLLAVYPFAQRSLLKFLMASAVCLFWFYVQFANMFGFSFVAHAAHVGGGVAGLVMLCWYNRHNH